MLVKFTVFDSQPDSYESKGKTVHQRQYILQDASEGAKLKQYVEMPVSADAPLLKVGSTINVEITEIPQIFSGRPRIRGVVRELQVEKTGK